MAAPTWGSREQVLGRRLSWAIKTAVLPRALLGRQKERCGKSKRGGQVNALFSPPSSCNGSLGLLGCFLLKPESQASCYEYPSCGVMQCLSCV